MAELASKWGVTANTVSRRLAFLGIKPERQGNLRYITADQLALGDELQHHITSGKPMELFRIVNKPEGGLVTRRVKEGGLVTGQVEQMAAMAAAMAALMPAAPVARYGAPRRLRKRQSLVWRCHQLNWPRSLSCHQPLSVVGLMAIHHGQASPCAVRRLAPPFGGPLNAKAPAHQCGQ